MTMRLVDLPRGAWAQVLRLSALVLAGAIVVSVAVTCAIMNIFASGPSPAGIATAVIVPILVGGPATVVHLALLAQLRRANQKLQELASTDGLTACLNRRAFTSRAGAELRRGGAFLVIDADNFKQVNDRFGHDRGDEALQLIARAIGATLRDGDLLGRMGGEEFGVLLPGATLESARLIAERIRAAVAAIPFAPNGEPYRLAVSVGGAAFDGAMSFAELFRIADRRLYAVKRSGRDRAEVARAAPLSPERGALALAG